MANTALTRTETALLTNKSGGSVAQGDVVIVDTANAAAFTTTTTGAYVAGRIGVVLEPNGIASNAIGLIAFGGYVPVITLSGTGSIGDIVKTHTVAKQGVRHASPQVAGDFAQVLGTTATPAALLFGTVQLGGGSGITMDQADPYGLHHRLSGSSADDDEFSSNTVGSYTAVTPTGSVNWVASNGVLSCLFSGQSANDICALLKAMTLANGEWFETRVLTITKKLVNYTMAGLVVTDGVLTTSNAFAVIMYQSATANELVFELWTGTLTNMTVSAQSYVAEPDSQHDGVKLMLLRNSSTSFSYKIGISGAQFSGFGSTNANPGFTPTHAGAFVSVWGGAQTAIAEFDYIRHMA